MNYSTISRKENYDGTTSFSPVRTVQFTDAFKPEAMLYPNPTTGLVSLNLTSLPVGIYAVSLVNATGQTLCTQQLAAGQEHVLDLSALPLGTYVVRIADVPTQRAFPCLNQVQKAPPVRSRRGLFAFN